MLPALLTLLALAVPTPADFSLVLTTTQGGINPSEETFELQANGSVLHRTSSLLSKQLGEERWNIGSSGVEAIRARLRRVDPAVLSGTLNEARGSQVAFATHLRVVDATGSHEVTAYTFGKPAPPKELMTLVADLRVLLADPAKPR